MPTYQYRCTECGHDLEAVQKFSDAALTECPSCHGQLRKVYNAVGVVFKGSGFYRTDSRKPEGSSTGSSNGSSSDGSSSGSASSGSEGKGSSGSGSSESGGSGSSSTSGTKTEGSKTPAKAGSSSSTGSSASS